MVCSVGKWLRQDTVMFEYDVHDMEGAVRWYRDVLGLEIVFEGGPCHSEFALPLPGARLALSLVDGHVEIRRGARVFLPTTDIHSVRDHLQEHGVEVQAIRNVHDVVLVLEALDPDGNPLTFEQWIGR